MQVLILAGGMGTRLGSLTKNLPKSLVPINNKPFLEYQLEFLKRNNIHDIVLCVGHLGSQIIEQFGDGSSFNVNIRYSIEDELLGTAGAIKKAGPLLDDVFFTMYGDSYIFLDFRDVMRFFESNDNLALMTVYKNHNLYDRSNTAVKGNLVKKYSKTEISPDMVYIDYGVNVFRKRALDIVPENTYCSLETIFPRLIEAKEFLAYEVKDRFFEIGSVNGLTEFTNYIKERK
jgi:N-acetyl-alpha-D-muramate 1-phosphate uridylyltransferase